MPTAPHDGAPQGVIQPYVPTELETQEPEPFTIFDAAEAAIARQTEILRSGTYTAPPLLHALDNGQVLLISQVRPHAPGSPPAGQSPSLGGWVSRWGPVLMAAGTVVGIAVAGVLLYLFAAGLMALVKWGTENALTIGAMVAFGVVGVLVFLGALTKARHGHPGTPRSFR